MKRSALKRKTPLKRGRNRMLKVKSLPFAISQWRKRYLMDHGSCALGYSRARSIPATELHEITAGKNRHKSLTTPAAILAVSRHGHDTIQGWPIAKQLALKLLCDPEEFDLTAINAILGVKGQVAPTAITLMDVLSWLRLEE
jgi:hypothetical protein